MENSQARILAYNLAKELNPKELDEVSGGAGWITTSHTCFVPTGPFSNLDGIVDVSVDW
ncbi:MAG: hypothetical protein H0U73_14075 [Tatlockia sp.]|nr:hypothetical protein [Tatlockia sp.]